MGAGALAGIGLAASLIGTGISMYGQSQQAAAQQKAANYQAQVARNNAEVAQQNAQSVQDQAAIKAQQDLRVATMKGSAQRAQLGANGVALDSGSAMDVTGATAGAGMVNAQNDTFGGDLSARSYLQQASNFTAQSGLDTMQGQNAASAGDMAMASTFLSGASQVSGKWNAWKNTTTPPTRTDLSAGGNGVGTSFGTGGLY